MKSSITKCKRRPHDGFTLIEVLVALLVLSIGLLGLAALQTTSLQFNTDSYTRTQATLLAYDIIDRMRANATGVTGGNYDVGTATLAGNVRTSYGSCKGSGGSCACGTSTCTPANLAIYDLGQWYDRMERLLPESSSKLAIIERINDTTLSTYNQVTITIKWRERDLDKQQQWIVQL